MAALPSRPDLAQLRRQAKDLHRSAAEGDPRGLRRVRAVSDRTTLSAAQLAVAREHGFDSWPRLRAAVEASQVGATPLSPDKHTRPTVRGAKEFLAWARTQGWGPGAPPVGAIFTSQSFITSHLEANPDRFRLSDSLTPTNGRVFMTTTEPSVAIACLGVGAPAVVTLLEHLAGLGVGSFIAVGPAPAVAELRWGDCVVIDKALRDDGVSQHYVEPGRYALADEALTRRLYSAATATGLEPRIGSTWTVPTPYRTTAEELAAYRAEGVLVTELTTAALFAVASALGVRAASAVIVTRTLDVTPATARTERRPGRVASLLEAAVDALRLASEAVA